MAPLLKRVELLRLQKLGPTLSMISEVGLAESYIIGSEITVVASEHFSQQKCLSENMIAWACIMSLGFILSILFIYLSVWFIIPFFLIIFCARFVFNRIVCPSCGTPVIYGGSIWGLQIYGGFFWKKCRKCGWDLRIPKPDRAATGEGEPAL